MENDVRLIDGNGRYTLHASDNTDYRLLFRNGIICVENELGHCVCKFYSDDAPTVDAVEVVHARWHDVYLMTPWIATGICSHCNLKSYINPDFPFAKYCPNCGAKMDGEYNGV